MFDLKLLNGDANLKRALIVIVPHKSCLCLLNRQTEWGMLNIVALTPIYKSHDTEHTAVFFYFALAGGVSDLRLHANIPFNTYIALPVLS